MSCLCFDCVRSSCLCDLAGVDGSDPEEPGDGPAPLLGDRTRRKTEVRRSKARMNNDEQPFEECMSHRVLETWQDQTVFERNGLKS